jgi:hypothetical protein
MTMLKLGWLQQGPATRVSVLSLFSSISLIKTKVGSVPVCLVDPFLAWFDLIILFLVRYL